MGILSRFKASITLVLLLTIVVGVALFGSARFVAHAAGAKITVTPKVDPPNTSAVVTGSGFGSKETVALTFDTTALGTATTSTSGSFSQKVRIPIPALPGNHTVQAAGNTSGLTAQAPFLVQTNWPNFGFNPGNKRYNGYENIITPQKAATLKLDWNYNTGSAVISSPVVDAGILYTASGGKVYALNPVTGKLLWSYTTGAASQSTPAVGGGVVYYGSGDGKLYALNALTGAFMWSYSTGNAINSSPLVTGGVVYFGSTDDKVTRLIRQAR